MDLADRSMHVNCQFDEGPKGPMLSWDCTSEMSKCDTGNILFCNALTANLQLRINRKLNNIRSNCCLYKTRFLLNQLTFLRAETCILIKINLNNLGWVGGQCHICSSHSYNPNLTSGPSGPRQIGNCTS